MMTGDLQRRANVNAVGRDGGKGMKLGPRGEIIAQKPKRGQGAVEGEEAQILGQGNRNVFGKAFGRSWV